MNHRKIYFSFWLLLCTASLIFTSCRDYSDLDLESPGGDADFTSVVAVGNSLTAGYQSASLYETAQRYSFPAIVAGQIATVQEFEQPLISDPGISLQGGRLELDGTMSLTDPANLPAPTDEQGQPINTDPSHPYRNLGIPGALLADFLGRDLPGLPYAARRQANPFFDIILGEANTQSEQMAALEPTFVMFWLGTNEVLGYVTSGGNRPYLPSDTFSQLYAGSIQTINQTEASAVLYNIPDVTAIPYVFLVNARLVQAGTIAPNTTTGNYELVTPQGNVPIWVEATDPANPGVVQDTVRLSIPNPQAGQPGGYFILPASSQLSGLFSSGAGTTPSNPIPHALILDNGEALQAAQLIAQYNQTIANQASTNGFALVDINGAFSQIVNNFFTNGGGITMNGTTLQPVPGSLFSLDGVHPGNRGHGVVANFTIDAINETYNANLQRIDIGTIPRGIPVSN